MNFKISCPLLPQHVKTWLLLVISISTLIPVHTVLKCFTIFFLLLIYNNLYPFPLILMVIPLDLLIASSACTFRSVFQSDRISDHFTVIGVMSFLVPSPAYHKTISYRNLKSIDLDAFRRDILNSDLIICPADNAVDLANQYNSVLSSILDKHAPLKSKRVSCRPDNPWMSPSIIEAKRHRRYLERTWRHNPTPLNRSRLTKQTNFCNRLMSKAKSNYYTFKLLYQKIPLISAAFGKHSTRSFIVTLFVFSQNVLLWSN